MRNKIICCNMILIILEIICLFVPHCFKEELWVYEASLVYHGRSSHGLDVSINIFGVYHGITKVLAIVIIAVMFLSFIAYLLDLLKKRNKLTDIEYWIPVASFSLLLIFTVIAHLVKDGNSDLYYEYSVDWLYYIIMILHIIVIVFSMILKYKNFEEKIEIPVHTFTYSEPKYSEIEELRLLLDKGILTPEEYAQKKKQILGL